MVNFPQTRPRRLRSAPWIRQLVRENSLSTDDLIWTMIVTDQDIDEEPVKSMPGVNRFGFDRAISAAHHAHDLGIPALALFPHIDPNYKDWRATEALNTEGLVPSLIREIKKEVPDIGLIIDVALDPYTDHGHDGLVKNGIILNDETLKVLAESAVILADAGADVIAPSDMMDGRVGVIRDSLDNAGHTNTAILSYAAKYASGFYGPYRDAIGTATQLIGDKRTYQMDPANSNEALKEVELDLQEGADMIMVKPGMPYLDIIYRVKSTFQCPTFAFQVSGEYAMISAAGLNGWIDQDRAMLESLLCFKRAGCDGILTYFAPRVAEILNSE